MSKKSPTPLAAAHGQRLMQLGERLRAARLRRKLTTTLMAERMGASRETLRRLELGDASVAFGHYFAALHVLGLGADLDLLAQEDVLGRQLQDAALPLVRKPRTHTTAAATPLGTTPTAPLAAVPVPPPTAAGTHPSVAAALAKFQRNKG